VLILEISPAIFGIFSRATVTQPFCYSDWVILRFRQPFFYFVRHS
jgi:hypothetical protein